MSTESEIIAELQRVVDENDPSKAIPITQAVQKFLDNEKEELAPNTLKEYERELKRFAAFCERNGNEDSTDIDGRVLHDFKIWRRDKGHDGEGSLSSKTMRDEMYLLKKFLRFLASIEAVSSSLHTKVEIPSLSPGEGQRNIEFESDEVDAILNHLEKYEYATREHVVWVLFAATGRRPSGLRALDCEDVHLDVENPYLEFRHRVGEENATRLKNEQNSETSIHLSSSAAEIIQDYIEIHRIETEENDRRPLLTTKHGRLSGSPIRKYVYKWSRPCVIGKACPEDRNPEDCEAMESGSCAGKCPFSKPPYALRHGYISNLRRERTSLHTISDRCDVSEDIIKKHYSELSEEEKRELRRKELEENTDTDSGYL